MPCLCIEAARIASHAVSTGLCYDHFICNVDDHQACIHRMEEALHLGADVMIEMDPDFLHDPWNVHAASL